jgi:hypothetical protein
MKKQTVWRLIVMTEPLVPLRTYVEPAPSLSDPPDAPEFYQALGIAMVAWGRLEGHFTLITITLLNLGLRKRKKFPMKREGQVEVWREALDAVPALVALKSRAERFLAGMEELAGDRHRIVHCNWGLFQR